MRQTNSILQKDASELFGGGKAEADVETGTTTNVEAFLSSVFTYMAAALLISGALAYAFGETYLKEYLFYETRAGGHGMTGLGWIVTLSPLAFILVMNFGMQKLSVNTLMLLFIAFSACMGMSLGSIFLTYTSASIFQTFGVAGITFGIMAVVGYTTKTDLTKLGKLLTMALIGILIAMVINIFIGSGGLNLVISILGVIVFTGLTAYETQQLKRIGSGVEYGSESATKLALMGAMSLYLTFINLFLFLLQLMGNRE
ncbi:MAG: Bax inhibitor-1/YccA family protein [Flavobacteriales bacterium]